MGYVLDVMLLSELLGLCSEFYEGKRWFLAFDFWSLGFCSCPLMLCVRK
jgi:hypothetical protein